MLLVCVHQVRCREEKCRKIAARMLLAPPTEHTEWSVKKVLEQIPRAFHAVEELGKPANTCHCEEQQRRSNLCRRQRLLRCARKDKGFRGTTHVQELT